MRVIREDAAKAAAARIPEIEDEIRGLRLAKARQNGGRSHQESLDTIEDALASWAEMTRPDAILNALKISSKALAPSDIVGVLHENGRDDKVEYVSATLSILKKRGAVRRAGYGRWLATHKE